jgi:serine/threonine protein kinase
MVRVLTDDEIYVVKVPFAGTEDSWTQADANNLYHENTMIQHIRRVTNVPVPEIIDFAPYPRSIFGYPFTIMRKLPGKCAHYLWFEEGEDPFEQGDYVTKEVETLRHSFLRSLAHTMSELQNIDFPSTGVADWSDDGPRRPPKMIPRHTWDYTKPETAYSANEKLHTRYDPCQIPRKYFKHNIDTRWPENIDPEGLEQMEPGRKELISGVRKVLNEMILPTPAFTLSRRDPSAVGTRHSFVLAHNDLDLQNILVDNEGNVTGILDWDNCSIVPRSVGYASLPLFLRKDWLPGWDLRTHPYTSWTLNEYQDTYINAMMETGCPDARYTRKSGMYHAVRAALYEGGDILDALQKILAEIPEFRRISHLQLLQLVGRGNHSLEPLMAKKLWELLTPDMVPTDSTESVHLLQELPFHPTLPNGISRSKPTEPTLDPYGGPKYLPTVWVPVGQDFILSQHPEEKDGNFIIYVMSPPKTLPPVPTSVDIKASDSAVGLESGATGEGRTPEHEEHTSQPIRGGYGFNYDSNFYSDERSHQVISTATRALSTVGLPPMGLVEQLQDYPPPGSESQTIGSPLPNSGAVSQEDNVIYEVVTQRLDLMSEVFASPLAEGDNVIYEVVTQRLDLMPEVFAGPIVGYSIATDKMTTQRLDPMPDYQDPGCSSIPSDEGTTISALQNLIFLQILSHQNPQASQGRYDAPNMPTLVPIGPCDEGWEDIAPNLTTKERAPKVIKMTKKIMPKRPKRATKGMDRILDKCANIVFKKVMAMISMHN